MRIGFSERAKEAFDDVARSAWRAAVILVGDDERIQLAEELATQLGRGNREVQLSLSRALVALGAEVVAPVLQAAMASDAPVVRSHALATERLLIDANTGVDLAVHEARRQFALKDRPA